MERVRRRKSAILSFKVIRPAGERSLLQTGRASLGQRPQGMRQRRRCVAAGKHNTARAADDDRSISEVGSVALFDRGVKGIAVDVGDRQCMKCGMMDLARRPARAAPLSRCPRNGKGAAITATMVVTLLLRAPQPSGAPYSSRIAVNRGKQPSENLIRKYEPPPQ
jgi:hypothetical protein